MAKVRISRAAIDAAIAETQRTGAAARIYDTSLTGFGFRAAVSGGGSYFLEYRLPARGVSTQRYRLGSHGQLTPASARELAQQLAAKAAHGIDIQTEKQNTREKAAGARFLDLVPAFIEWGLTTQVWAARTAKECEYTLKGTWKSLHGKAVAAIAREDVKKVLDGLTAAGKPSAANHALADLRRFLNWAAAEKGVSWAARPGEASLPPTHGIDAPAPKKKRRVKPSDRELASLWIAAEDDIGYPYGDIIRLGMLLNVRRAVAAGMRWPDIDFDKARWTYARKNRGEGSVTIPLPETAAGILARIKSKGLQSVYVFPARGNTERPFSGFSKAKKRLEAATKAKAGGEDATFLADWRPHDFRRYFKSLMGEEEIASRDVVEVMMDHTIAGVDGDYDMAKYLKPMSRAFLQWERHLLAIVAAERQRRGAALS